MKLTTKLRTHVCGQIQEEHIGQEVALAGWVHRSRDLGGLTFVDLRDRAGIVQVSFDPTNCGADVAAAAAAVGQESVVLIEGEVVARPDAVRNKELETGDVEVRGMSLRVVGPATPPAIPVARARNENLAAEELRLRHRFLDLRRTELQQNILLRHSLMQATRAYLSDNGFFEIETPILTKPTPEGARDYLVPSRVHPGEFYALPQSPQLYKQLLMVAGFDRYFQIARCFRDEDLRQDRQPEFTQIDIEASFIAQEDIMRLAEGLVARLWTSAGHDVAQNFRRIAYAEAMERYGSDRPDTRYAPGPASIVVSERASAAALDGRSSGFFARQASTSASSAAGTGSSERRDGGTGASWRCRAISWIGVSASNTRRPVSR